MTLSVNSSGWPTGWRKARMFWILNMVFWLFFILREFLAIHYYDPSFPEYYFLASLTYLTGFGFSVLLRYLFIFRISRISSLMNMALVFGLVLVIGSVFWRFLDALVSYPFWIEQFRARYAAFSWMDHVMETFQYMLTLLVWGAIYFIVFLFDRIVTQEVKAKQAESLAIESRFRLLQNQLNPHFLFNSLNSIRALIFENQQKAADLITELSGFLRYNLQQGEALTIPLQEEMSAIETYCSIEQKRYEEDLKVTLSCDPGCKRFRVIPNLLLPLVDNAIKHGMQTSMMPLMVSITAGLKGSRLHLEVTNTGEWNDRSIETAGIGLKNVEERLKNLYQDQYFMKIDRDPGMVKVILEIPQTNA